MGRSTHRYSERKSSMSQKDFEVIQPLNARPKKKRQKKEANISKQNLFFLEQVATEL